MEDDKEINIVSEAIRSWIVKIIILSLNVVVIFFIFPFIKKVSIIVILFLSIALYCGINTFANKKTRIIKLRWLSLSCFFTTMAFVWVIFGPIVVLKHPIYVFFRSSYTPFGASIESIIPDKDDSGSLLILADPVRKRMFPIWKSLLGDNIRLLETEKFGDKNYIIFPLHIRFEKNELGVISNYTVQTIWIPLSASGINLDMEISKMKGVDVTVGTIYGSSDLVKSSYLISPSIPPWRAILTGDNPSIKELQYASILDNALSFSIYGNVDDIISQLEYAGSIAPNKIEEARIFYLLGNLTEIIINGNIGKTQSLAIYLNAYEIMKKENEILQKGDPVKNWILNGLTGTFQTYGNLYREQIFILSKLFEKNIAKDYFDDDLIKDFKAFQKLKNNQTLPISKKFHELLDLMNRYNNEKNPFDNEKERIRKLSLDQFRNEAGKYVNNFSPEALLFVELSLSTLNQRVIDDTIISFVEKLPGEKNGMNISNPYLAKVKSLREIISKFPEPLKSAYLEKLKYHEGFGKYFLFLNKQSIKDSNNAKLLGVKLLEVMSAIPQMVWQKR